MENLGCRMSHREPSKVIEQRNDADKSAFLVGQWKMACRSRRWEAS